MAISSINNWTIKTTDIKSAFLQGREIRWDVYVKPQKESDTAKGIIWKLKHGYYGLKDGAIQFYLSVKEELLRLGCKMCDIDPAVFFLNNGGKLSGIICCHVDDFLHAGDEHLEKIMVNLRKRQEKLKNRALIILGSELYRNQVQSSWISPGMLKI